MLIPLIALATLMASSQVAMATTVAYWPSQFNNGYIGWTPGSNNSGCYSQDHYYNAVLNTGTLQLEGKASPCVPAGGVGLQVFGNLGVNNLHGLSPVSPGLSAAMAKIVAENAAQMNAALTQTEERVALAAGYPSDYFTTLGSSSSSTSPAAVFFGGTPVTFTPQTNSLVNLQTSVYFVGTLYASAAYIPPFFAQAQYNLQPYAVVIDQTTVTSQQYGLSGLPGSFSCTQTFGTCNNSYNQGYTLTTSFPVNSGDTYTIWIGIYITVIAAQVGAVAAAYATFCPSSVGGHSCASSDNIQIQYIQLSY